MNKEDDSKERARFVNRFIFYTLAANVVLFTVILVSLLLTFKYLV